MILRKLKPFQNGLLQVVIETPKGSAFKYDYDPEKEIYCLNKLMPLGLHFPYDFGFIPGTRGEDGDPLDVLVMMEFPCIQGALLECRVLGILEANQVERDGKHFRNDRIIAVSDLSLQYKTVRNIGDLYPGILTEMESFFKQYNTLAGKEFSPIGWKDDKTALTTIQSQVQ